VFHKSTTVLFAISTTVFLSRFGAFLTSLFIFAQQLVQPPQHFVISAHHNSSFSFLPTNCKCFWTCINCFHTTHCCFITLSFAYSLKSDVRHAPKQQRKTVIWIWAGFCVSPIQIWKSKKRLYLFFETRKVVFKL